MAFQERKKRVAIIVRLLNKNSDDMCKTIAAHLDDVARKVRPMPDEMLIMRPESRLERQIASQVMCAEILEAQAKWVRSQTKAPVQQTEDVHEA